MRKILITGIVLSACFVGTASDSTHITFTESAMLLGSAQSTLETFYLIDESPTLRIFSLECQHEKLKAIGDNCWGMISKHDFCPTEYRQRAYKCRECKKKIVILQAILIENEGN